MLDDRNFCRYNVAMLQANIMTVLLADYFLEGLSLLRQSVVVKPSNMQAIVGYFCGNIFKHN